MTVNRAYLLSLHLLAAISMAALASAERSGFAMFLALLLPIVAFKRRERPLGRATTNLLSVAALLVGPLDYAAGSGDPMVAAAHLLMAVQFVKLFGPDRPRDHMQILAISLMHVAVAAVMTIDLQFSLWFALYAVVATWTLILFCLDRELRRAAPQALEQVRIGRHAPLAGLALAAGMLTVTGFTFLVFPRFSAVLLRVQRPQATRRIAGFSTEMGLSDIASIQSNDAKVMEVIIESSGSDLPERPLWRGLAFDRYREGRWLRSWSRGGFGAQIRDVPYADSGRAPAMWIPIDPEADGAGGEPSVYSVTLHPTGTDVLFAAPRVRRLAFLSARRPRFLRVTPGQALRAIGNLAHDVRYRVETVPPRREAARRAGIVPGGRIDGADYLVLSDTGLDIDRLRSLAERVVRRAGARTAYEKAEALSEHLRTHYRYSLEMEPPPATRDPVEYFLYERGTGHCELFASAFVLMCRALGLPSRLVNGFSSGEWNELGGFWQVRQRDAHAWAEVHFAGVGWIPFDPTPPAATAPDAPGWFAAVGHVYDYLRLRWLNHVIGYGLADQLEFAERLRRGAHQAGTGLRSSLEGLNARLPALRWPGADRRLALVVFGAVLAVGIATAVRRRRRRERAASDPVLERLRRSLARHGYHPATSETAIELARRARALGPEPEEIALAYYEMRYGARELTPQRRARLERAFATLDALPRSSPAPPADS